MDNFCSLAYLAPQRRCGMPDSRSCPTLPFETRLFIRQPNAGSGSSYAMHEFTFCHEKFQRAIKPRFVAKFELLLKRISLPAADGSIVASPLPGRIHDQVDCRTKRRARNEKRPG